MWGSLFDTLSSDEVLSLCVGDTLDAPRRKTFPKTKAALVAAPQGPELFDAARAALVAIGKYNADYRKIAAKNPDKFCHGFGIFQYDIQFCQQYPDFFI